MNEGILVIGLPRLPFHTTKLIRRLRVHSPHFSPNLHCNADYHRVERPPRVHHYCELSSFSQKANLVEGLPYLALVVVWMEVPVQPPFVC